MDHHSHVHHQHHPHHHPQVDPTAAFHYEQYQHQQQQYGMPAMNHHHPQQHAHPQGPPPTAPGAKKGAAKDTKAAKAAMLTANARNTLTISTSTTGGPPNMMSPYQSHANSSVDSSPSGSPRSDDGAENEHGPDGLKSNRLCTMPGCKKRVRSKGLCKAHGGGRRCMVDGCERSSQGQGLCIRHGGGKRCTQSGCTKASQSNGLCKAHGGGLRCQTNGCTKSSQGGGFCRAHGGGQRCEKEGCNKGAQRGGFCAGHGGSRFCQHPDCTKNDRGGGYCAEHGGGKRCDSTGCNKPARKKGKCSFHANASKGKAPKGDPSASGPQNIMDMRQITTPAFNNSNAMAPGKEARDAHAAVDHQSMRYQRGDMDLRYPKGYEQAGVPMSTAAAAAAAASSQYLQQIHGDQRSYDPMSMQSHNASRHYMGMDSAHGPPVSTGYPAAAPSHKQQQHPSASQQAYNQREAMKPSGGHHGNVNPYAQQQPWSAKENAGSSNAMASHHVQDRSSLDYFDMKEQAPHHQPYPSSSSQYHHHLSAADSAAAAAAYSNQRNGGNSYYHHPHAPSGAGADAAGQQQQGMMYYSANGYPPQHQMHSMQQQMQLL